ncbi:MAG: hypothetical protein P1P90_00240 [Patescibacteria group bacterium]|nr:hypothetical protein [Patescibacteria group bacterium]
MNYDFWKKAGIATGALGTIAIAGSVLASDAMPTATTNNQYGSARGVMQRMHNAKGFMNNEEMQKALENRDYNAFLASITKESGTVPKQFEAITADNFNRFVDMHDAMQNKDFETAKAIADELGLKQPGMRGEGRGQGMQIHTLEEREAIRTAAIAGDYQTWFNLVAVDGELPEHLQVINADNFARFSQMHQLMDGAKGIREELGLEVGHNGGQGKGMGGGRGMHRGTGMGFNQQ